MKQENLTLRVNGREHHLALAPNATLLQALRDLGHTDVKCGCEKGDCGACAILLDGVPVNSCLVLALQADGCDILTCAGLGTLQKPHPLQEAFADAGAVQCGFCTPGMIVSAYGLLSQNPQPDEAEIREALSGNLCRCTGYGQIISAVQLAAARMAPAGRQGAPDGTLPDRTAHGPEHRHTEPAGSGGMSSDGKQEASHGRA